MSVTSEVFLTVLKVNDNVEELAATKEILNKELTILVSLVYLVLDLSDVDYKPPSMIQIS